MRLVWPLLCLVLGCGPSEGMTVGPGDSTVPTPGATTSYSGPPNQLIVLMDDVGLERLSGWSVPYESDKATTPVMDSLIEQGLIFDNAYAAPTCSPTRAALMTGLYPRRNGISKALDSNVAVELDAGLALLPVAMGEQGYSTAWIGKWHLTGSKSDCGHAVRLGFDVFAGSMYSLSETTSSGGSQGYARFEKCNLAGELELVSGVFANQDTLDDLLLTMQDLPEPWVIVANLHAAHSPFSTPPDGWHHHTTFNGSDTDNYIGLIESIDVTLGLIRDQADADQRARTNLWIMGDNGGPVSVRPLEANSGKGQLGDGGVRVPLVVVGPSVVSSGRSSAWIQVHDLMPTLVSMAGGDPGALGLDGLDYGGVFAEPDLSLRDRVFWEKFTPQGLDVTRSTWKRSLRDDRWKLIDHADSAGAFVEQRFYDLAADGGWDLNNLLDEGPLTGDALEAHDRLIAELDAQWPVSW